MAPPALELVLEHLLARKRADCGDFCVTNTELVGVVEHWVNMESRVFRLSTKQTQLVDELFLEGVGEIVLRTEEDYATL